MTYAKILDEISNVTCLQLALLKMRHQKQQKNENSQNVGLTPDQTELSKVISDSESNSQQLTELTKFANLAAGGGNLSGYIPVRKNSHTVDMSNEQVPLSSNQNAYNMQKLFLDEFIVQPDLNQT